MIEKEDIEKLKVQLNQLSKRVGELESKDTAALPIPLLTPSSDLEDIKKSVNYIINYLNIGVRYG